ncbi:RNA polymerase I-specific transcription initiation factor RRN3 [Chytriomyces cf. hyalinus JEL632]|nr:RNA polymerase I-specific transcription initiation factor RRN3 [Chytriomyces cf. hyalinus JEL632]
MGMSRIVDRQLASLPRTPLIETAPLDTIVNRKKRQEASSRLKREPSEEARDESSGHKRPRMSVPERESLSESVDQSVALDSTKEWTHATALQTLSVALSRGSTDAVAALLHPTDRATRRLPAAQLECWLAALSGCVSRMQSLSLVHAVLRIDWLRVNSVSFVNEYGRLMENLVSANASFAAPVLQMLVSSLRSACVDKESPALLSTKFDSIHSILAGVLRLIPSAPSLLTPLISENFPHKTESAEQNMWYLKNLMRLASYAPVLENSIWIVVVDKLVQIDVEIQTSLDDLDEDEYDSVLQHCFDFDGAELDSPDLLASPSTFASAGKAARSAADIPGGELSMESLYDEEYDQSDSDSNSDSDIESDEDENDDEFEIEVAPVITDFREMAGKLDSMLQYLLQQVTRFHKAHEKEEFVLEGFFSNLLNAFERTVLPTHKCRYTQFLFFHATSLSSKWCEGFLVLLAQKSFDVSTPAILRVSAVSYLSSFISRATFLDKQSLLQCLRLLTAWCVQYVEANETGKTNPDMKRDLVFYSTVQAVLYIFCFRWREIVDDGGRGVGSSVQLPDEMAGFQRIVMSKFAPLQICTKSIVSEFARITHKLDILYCYSLMKRSDSLSSVNATENGSKSNALSDQQNQATNQSQTLYIVTDTLDAFFPFDPCNLLMSRKIIQPCYAEWKDEEEDQLEGVHIEPLQAQDAGSFGTSFSDTLSASLDNVLSFEGIREGLY